MQARSMQGAAPPTQGSFSLWSKYHTTVRFQSVLSGTFVYTIATSELRGFSYGIGSDLGPVGFPAGTSPATFADTNLQVAASTISGETVEIFGVSIMIAEDSEPVLAKLLAPNTSVTISLNGENNKFRLGTVSMVPGGGGIFGSGDSRLTYPAQQYAIQSAGAIANGWPDSKNYLPLPESLYWKPQGQTDGSLAVNLKLERQIAYTTLAAADRAAVPASGVATQSTSGAAAWVHPASTTQDVGTYVTYKIHLQSQQSGSRSVNQ